MLNNIFNKKFFNILSKIDKLIKFLKLLIKKSPVLELGNNKRMTL